jgi:hypothetical protein
MSIIDHGHYRQRSTSVRAVVPDGYQQRESHAAKPPNLLINKADIEAARGERQEGALLVAFCDAANGGFAGWPKPCQISSNFARGLWNK